MPQLTFYYIVWHYTSGIRDFVRIWINFFWFWWNLFSISLLLRNLFSPFHRISEKAAPGFHPDQMFESFVVNLLMRLVGFFVKAILIVVGFIAILLTAALGSVLFTAWLCMPVVLAGLSTVGVLLLFA